MKPHAESQTIEVAETATKLLPVPLQQHLLGGCAINMSL